MWSISPSTVGISDDTDCTPEFYFPENTSQSDITYYVTLTVFTEFGCDSTITDTIVIHPTPFVDFTASPPNGCDGLDVSLTNNSSPSLTDSINTMIFEWSVDAVPFSSAIDTSYIFNNTTQDDTSFIITLIGTTQYGCQSSDGDTITIYPYPIAEIQLDNDADTVNCKDFVIDSSVIAINHYPNANDSYLWVYIDINGDTIVQNNDSIAPSHTMLYEQDTVTVYLIVNNDHDCQESIDSILFVTYPDPVADFIITTPYQGCDSLTVQTDTTINSTSGVCLLYTSPSPRDKRQSRMPSSA